jgi:hypothetical protein
LLVFSGGFVSVPSPLIHCLKCSSPISENAKVCPKCGYENLFCAICHEQIAPNDLSPLKHGELSGFHRSFHAKCIDALFNTDVGLSCNVCKAKIISASGSSILTARDQGSAVYIHLRFRACPNCGEPEPFGTVTPCYKCGLPIVPILHEQYKESSIFGEGLDYYHSKCRPDLRPSPPSQEKKRSLNGLLIGIFLGFVGAVILVVVSL